MGMVDNVSGEYSVGRTRWCRCGKIGMDTVAEEMWDGNRIDVGQQRWRNGFEGRRRTRQISKGNNYQLEGISLLR